MNGQRQLSFKLGLCLLCASIAFLAGCSQLGAKKNTGAIEHKFANVSDGEEIKFQKFFYPCTNNGSACALSKGLVREGDSVSIKLLTVFVCDFAEDNPFPLDMALWVEDLVSGTNPNETCSKQGIERSKHYTRGEIVVLANVFELGGSQQINFSEGNSDLDSARVVYYDDDVRESGQFLNMVNMPIYGPITYSGQPLYLRLVMMELDNEENSLLSSMLNSLAEFGKQSYPPSSLALSILNSVGSKLLSGDQDDVEFRYDMVFDGPGGEAEIYLPLKVGIYVFVRSEDRSADIAWPKDGEFDKDQARLKNGNSAGAFKRTDTYFVVSVARNEKALPQDSYQTFAQLTATTSSEVESDQLIEAANQLGRKYENLVVYDDLRFRATQLVKDSTSAVEKAQNREVITEAICGTFPKTDEQENPLPVNLSKAQLLRILAIAGPALADASVEDSERAMAATIEYWSTACQSSQN